MAKSNKLNALGDLKDTLNQLNREIASLGAEIKTQITGNLQGADEVAKQLAKTTGRDITRSLKEMSKGTEQILSNEERLYDRSLKQKDVAKQIANLTKTKEKLIEKLNNAEDDGFITASHRIEVEKDIRKNLAEQLIELKKQEKQAVAIEKTNQKLEAGMKRYMVTVGQIQKIPLLGKLIDASLIQERMKKTAEETGSKWKTLGAGVMATFEGIGKSIIQNPVGILMGIVGILTQIVKMVLEYEDKTFQIAKNLGVSVTHAEKLRNTFRGMAMSSANMGLSSSEIAESYGKMNEQLGFLAPTGRDFAETATKLEKRIGASAESMSALASFGALSGKNLTQAYKTAVGAATVGMARNKIAMSERQILEGISKVSSAVLINFKGNLPALAESIVRAKKLGTTLDQVAKQGDSLLDFETSLGNEFEAQVLTGKNLNLTKARELALMGDTKGLMEELNKQNMTFGEYSKMNMIQRQSFAQALGLSNEELSKQLLLQQQANQLGAAEGQSISDKYQQLLKEGKTREEIAASIGQSAEAELNRSSRAEQLAKTMENLKETLAAMLTDTILPMVDKVMAWFKSSVNIEKVADVIKGIFNFIGKAIEDLPSTLNKVATALKIIASLSIASAVANMVSGAAMTPGGFITGLAVGAGAYLYLDSLVPKFATGGIHEGGPMMVGEYGPEIVQAPKGSRIIPAQETANMVRGGGSGNEKTTLTVNMVVDKDVMATKTIEYTPQAHNAYLDNNTGHY